MPIRREFITMFFSLITVVFILSVSFPLVRGDVRVLNRQRFKYVVQVNEVIVSPNNPVSTKSSIQSPEQPNTVKEEVSPVKEETTLVDPDKPQTHWIHLPGFCASTATLCFRQGASFGGREPVLPVSQAGVCLMQGGHLCAPEIVFEPVLDR